MAPLNVAPRAPLAMAAATCALPMGGSTTFLLNFLRALGPEEGALRIFSPQGQNDLAAEFAGLGAEVHTAELGHLIYEDRLAWLYGELAAAAPVAVLACLGSESYEMLRLAPPGVTRIGLIQSDDPGPYALPRRFAPWLDAMVGVSAEIGARLRALPELAGCRVAEIPYGIHFQADPPRPPRMPGEPLRVLYLGRLVELQKRIGRVVELIRQIEAGPGGIEFTLAGSGPEEGAVREALRGSKIVRILGEVPNADIPMLLREQDVYVLLSDFEGLPLSLLEAMGEGVVPVVSDLTSGIGEVVDGTCGIRVPIGDVPAAAAALRRLQAEPALLRELGHAARERARGGYSARRMVEGYLSLIREIRAQKKEAPQWPAVTLIPAPLGLPAWQYRGVARRLRRVVKNYTRRP